MEGLLDLRRYEHKTDEDRNLLKLAIVMSTPLGRGLMCERLVCNYLATSEACTSRMEDSHMVYVVIV